MLLYLKNLSIRKFQRLDKSVYKIVPADYLFAESLQSHAGYLGSLSIHNDQDFYTKKS